MNEGWRPFFFVSAMIRDLVLEMIHSGKPTPIHYSLEVIDCFFTGSVRLCKTKLVFQKQCLLHEVHGTQGNDLVNDQRCSASPLLQLWG